MTARAWLVAARPPTLLAAVAPVLVGNGLAIGDGVFRWDGLIVTMITAVLLNVAVNFANDASDARRGADSEGRIGPPRAVATGLLTERQVWLGTAVTLSLAVVGGIYLTAIAGWVVIAIGVAAILAALTYTGGPAPYGYAALGEVSVFVFFGLAATIGSRYVHDRTAPLDAWLLALPVGMLVTAILVANNVRDIDTDRAAAKRTLAVILGRRATRRLYTALVVGPFVSLAGFVIAGWVPQGAALGLLAAPAAFPLVRMIIGHAEGPVLIAALKANALLHAAVGTLVALGVAI